MSAASNASTNIALRCEGLERYLGQGEGRVHVLRGVSFEARKGNETFVVSAPFIHHRNKLTPYEGETLRGVVRQTFLRGAPAFDRTHTIAPSGRWITRS